MVRKYKRKRPAVDQAKMREAINAVRRDKMGFIRAIIVASLLTQATPARPISFRAFQEADEHTLR